MSYTSSLDGSRTQGPIVLKLLLGRGKDPRKKAVEGLEREMGD